MKKSILSILFVALIGFAFAGNDENKEAAVAPSVSISGNVVDMTTGEALTGVEITLEGTDVKAYSDFDGNFTFTDVRPGDYNLVASFISYKKSLVEDFKVDGSKNVDIQLQED